MVVWSRCHGLFSSMANIRLDGFVYTVEGIRTTLPFFRAVVCDEKFRRGDFDTGFIDRFLKDGLSVKDSDADERSQLLEALAAIAAVLEARASAMRIEVSGARTTESRWKLYGRLNQRR